MTAHAVVVGASLAGLFATAALARNGIAVTVLDRDELPSEPTTRKGVPQGTQAHVLLYRGLSAAEHLLPGLQDDLLAAGGARFSGGQMPWLGEHGWLDPTIPGFELISVTRPLLEHQVRDRVRQLPQVRVRGAARVRGLVPSDGGWTVRTETGDLAADLVVDASGRSSRLPSWLAELGLEVPPPTVLDAQLGYACRLYRATGPLPVRTGIVIGSTPDTISGGLALPVENGHWLLMAGGNGALRPSRDAAELLAFFAGLRDPALAQLADLLEPCGPVHIHRQTQNRRHDYGADPSWPAGLLVVGDSACSFNPVYGQGITVAACQAEALDRALRTGRRPDRRLQRRLSAEADLAWSLATAADQRLPTSGVSQNAVQRVAARWTESLARLMASGDVAATLAFSRVYNLMAPPTLLLHPVLLAAAARQALRPRPLVGRPAVLDELSRLHGRRYGAAA